MHTPPPGYRQNPTASDRQCLEVGCKDVLSKKETGGQPAAESISIYTVCL
jgi:hypothetical protein